MVFWSTEDNQKIVITVVSHPLCGDGIFQLVSYRRPRLGLGMCVCVCMCGNPTHFWLITMLPNTVCDIEEKLNTLTRWRASRKLDLRAQWGKGDNFCPC